MIVTGGGYGSQRILPFLDYEMIRTNPKVLVGFSDTSALQLGLLKMTGLMSYTGFTLCDTESENLEPLIAQTLDSCLFGKSYHLSEGMTVNPGLARGHLVGGNLTLIASLVGTPWQPDFNGSILFFEEVFSEPYIVDGMLSHLDLAGVFNQVAGIIIGQFEECSAKHFPDRDGTVDEVIHDWVSHFKVPCIKNFPYGHKKRRCVLPLGGTVTLDAHHQTVTIV